MRLIDVAGLTSAPVDTKTYCRALGLEGHLVPADRRLAVLRRLSTDDEPHVLYTGPAAADAWLLAKPQVVVRTVPGDGELPASRRLDGYALWDLLYRCGLSKAKAKALIARKTDTELRVEVRTRADLWLSFPPDDLQGLEYVGDKGAPGADEARPYQWKVVDNPLTYAEVGEQLAKGGTIGLDVEGTSEDSRAAELVGVGLSFDRQHNYYLPLNGPLGSEPMLSLLRLHLPNISYVAHNAKYDYKVAKRAGLPIDEATLAGDGMIAAYVLAEVDEMGRPRSKGLKQLTERLLGEHMQTFSEMLAIGKATDASDSPLDVIGPYCCGDAFFGVEIERAVRELIEQRGPRLDLYTKLELPNVTLLAEMELAGLPIDLEATKVRRRSLAVEVTIGDYTLGNLAHGAGWGRTRVRGCREHTRARARIAECPFCDGNGKIEEDVDFNPASGPMLREVLQGIFHLRTMGFTGTGAPSWDEAALLLAREEVKKDRPPLPTRAKVVEFITELLAYRKDSKLLGTYLDNFVKQAKKSTVELGGHKANIYVIQPNYNQTVVESGRLSSDDPNAQNIPLHLRDLFVAPPGFLLWAADHSQLELRIMARRSGCGAMIEAFQSDQDIHALTAWRVFGITARNLTPEMRVRAKTLNFGVGYEASAGAVQKQVMKAALLFPELNLTVPSMKDCQLLIREFFKAYPEVPIAIEQAHETTRRLGYSETLYRRRRYLPNINHPSQELRARAERQAWNLQIQGTAGDIMKSGQLVVSRYTAEYDADLRCQVHDEVWGLVRQERANEWLEVVAKCLVLDQPLMPVPLKVSPVLANNWKEAK